MKLFEISFYEEVKAEKVEDVYEWLLTYMKQCVRNEDVEAFNFNEVSDTGIKIDAK
jgi:3-hydroxyacyl-CoA dehydrogenase